MGIFRQFPYSNFHDMNMDEIIKIVREMLDEWATYYATWEDWKNGVNATIAAFQNWFNTLDVQDEINNKINNMIATGEFASIVAPYIPNLVTAWLNEHVTEPEGVVIDTSLTIAGACADAKAAGDAIKDLRSETIEHINIFGAKNVINTPDRTYTVAGVTFTWKEGVCTLNGTATGTIQNDFASMPTVNGATYKMYGAVADMSLQVIANNKQSVIKTLSPTTPNDNEFTGNGVYAWLRIRINQGAAFNNVALRPSIQFAALADSSFSEYAASNNLLTEITKNIKNKLNISKNLFALDTPSGTVNGVTFTNQGNGVLACYGTASAVIYKVLGFVYLEKGVTYILSGNNTPSTFLQVQNYAGSQTIKSNNYGGRDTFTVDSSETYRVRLQVPNGASISADIMPMIMRAEDIYDAEFAQHGENIALFIGDSFAQGASLPLNNLNQYDRFSSQICRFFGWKEKNYAVGGMGFVYGDIPYSAQLQNAITDNSYDHYNVTKVFISGGTNDPTDNIAAIKTAAAALINNVKRYFGNADIYVIPMTNWDEYISHAAYNKYVAICEACMENKAAIIPDAFTWLIGKKALILPDNVHPNVAGHTLIASHIINALDAGNSNPTPAENAYAPVSDLIDTNAEHYMFATVKDTELVINGTFTLTGAAAAGTRLYEYSTSSKIDNTYIGNYGKMIPVQNINSGATRMLFANREETTNGYTAFIQTRNSLEAGTWRIMNYTIPYGIQEY